MRIYFEKNEKKVSILQVVYYDYGKISVYITVLIEIIITFADEMNPKEQLAYLLINYPKGLLESDD